MSSCILPLYQWKKGSGAVVTERAGGETLLQLIEHVLRHCVRVGEMCGAEFDPDQFHQFGIGMHDALDAMRDRRCICCEETRIEALDTAGWCDGARNQEQARGSGRRPASLKASHTPGSFLVAPSTLRPRQRPVSSQASRIAATASERARDGGVFGLPFIRLASSSGGKVQPPESCCRSCRRCRRGRRTCRA